MVKNLKKLAIWSFASIMSVGAVSCESNNQPKETPINPTIDCIMSRKSVRKFDSRTVSAETIETILKAGMAAPSAMNKQPWKFVVVQDKQMLKTIADSMPNIRTATAPMAIIVCGDMSKTLDGVAREFWVQDCSAATQNILLAAHSMGLGAVWNGLYPDLPRCKFISNLLQMDNRYIPLCVVPIGYPAENPEVKNKWKPENVIYKYAKSAP